MSALIYLIPAALLLGLLGLVGFLWALKSGQFEDLDGAAHRILLDDEDKPLPPSGGEPAGPRDAGSREP
ncbi:MAG: cbb3-type cytochrome oxidase assembly protein CcoS [Kiloniellaceae bacterium]